jgi:hypothetical protein
MTLSGLADLVCAKMHRTDDESRAEAKKYIASRYQMLWESRPWRDALGMLTLTAEPGHTLILPALVDRVLSVRRGDSATLQHETLSSMFLLDPSRFESVGEPVSFSIIEPSAVASSPGGGQVTLSSTDGDADFTVTIRGTLGTAEKTERLTISGSTPAESVHAYDVILSLSKSSTSSDLIVINADADEILSLYTWETSRSHQRLHFHSTPSSSSPLLILYKRKFKPLVADSDATEITGIDNAVLSAALADMLEGQRQFAKAQVKAGEASALAAAAADQETNQSANIIRIIPWDSGFETHDIGTKGYW